MVGTRGIICRMTTGPNVRVLLSSSVEQLDLSPVAVILCLSILGFLLLTTMIVLAIWRRKGVLDALPRDIDILGSVIGFVYASEGLLQLASSSAKDIKRGNGREEVFMGWFVSGGKRSWGVEVLEEKKGEKEKLGNVVDIRSGVGMVVSIGLWGMEKVGLFRGSGLVWWLYM